mgnify:CR=1 FL=1
MLREFLQLNPVLLSALISWTIAQALKVVIHFLQSSEWNWALLFRAGGMPSSHSAMVSAAAHAIGLFLGFSKPLFGLAVVFALIVIYDATGIRRQAGKQAALLNSMIEDISRGKLAQQRKLREVLGHTPGEAITGMMLGIFLAQVVWWIGG